MALIRKAVMLAITSGIAKKAWDAYRNKHPMEAGRAKANLKEAAHNLTGKDSSSGSSSTGSGSGSAGMGSAGSSASSSGIDRSGPY